MKKKRALMLIVIVVCLIAVILLPLISASTNCGGNSAALSYTFNVAIDVNLALKERHKESDPIAFLTLIPPESWKKVFKFGWGVRSYWVRKEIDPSGTEPIIICAQYFDNIPRPKLWNLYKRTPRFAAGFLFEPSRLLEIREYNALNFNEYQYISKEDILQKTSFHNSSQVP